jgi:hypothetical protein
MSEIFRRELRANPRYELVLFDRLPADERRALADLAREPGFYGVLRPREGSGLSGPGLRSVDRETALLFLTLREPGPLPSYVQGVLGEAAERTILRLVADGVLEVADGDGFVSGAAALGRLQARAGDLGSGPLAALSLAALRYAQDLPTDDVQRLCWSLYAFNRRPLTPGWQRTLPDSAAVEDHLGIDSGGANRERLDRGWSRLAMDGWLSWTRRGRLPGRPAGSGATWKLYVSPAPELLADGFGAVLEALTASRAFQLKIGPDALGLLRPDKIVAYFRDFESLARAADVVRERLAGVAAQGVPFTSGISEDGLLSWGVDPPRSAEPSGMGGSWRLWLARRLAAALVAGRNQHEEGMEPWRFALERVRLEGIDPSTWTPGARLWQES